MKVILEQEDWALYYHVFWSGRAGERPLTPYLVQHTPCKNENDDQILGSMWVSSKCVVCGVHAPPNLLALRDFGNM